MKTSSITGLSGSIHLRTRASAEQVLPSQQVDTTVDCRLRSAERKTGKGTHFLDENVVNSTVFDGSIAAVSGARNVNEILDTVLGKSVGSSVRSSYRTHYANRRVCSFGVPKERISVRDDRSRELQQRAYTQCAGATDSDGPARRSVNWRRAHGQTSSVRTRR